MIRRVSPPKRQQRDTKRLKTAQEFLNIASVPLLAIVHKGGRIVGVNRAATDLYGYTLTQMLRMSLKDLPAKSESDSLPDAPPRNHAPEQLHRKSDGSVFPVRIESLSLGNTGEDWTLMSVLRLDGSERSEGGTAGQSQEITFRTPFQICGEEDISPILDEGSQRIIQAALDGYVCLDLDGRFLNVNDSFAHMLGYSTSELLSMRVTDIDASETPSDTIAHIKYVIDTGSHRFETSLKTKAGNLVYVEVSATRDAYSPEHTHGFIRDVTPRRRAQEALRRSEEKFAKAFLLSPDIVSLSTIREEKYIDVNSAFESNTGHSRDDVIGKSTSDLGLWLTPSDWEEAISGLISGKGVRNKDISFNRKDGSVRSGLLSAELIWIEEIPYTLAVIHDITDQLAVDKMTRFQAGVLNAISQGVIVTDTKGVVLYWNHALETMFGWTKEEMLGQNVHDIVGPGRNDPQLVETLAGTVRDGLWEGENSGHRKDGTALQVSVWSATMEDAIVGGTSIVSIVTDISERKRSEAALRESEQWYRELFENSADPIGVAAIDGRILDANPAGCSLFGCRRAGLRQMKIQDIAQSQWEGLLVQLPEILKGERDLFEWSIGSSPQALRYIEVNVRSFTYNGQQSLLGIGRDITERRRIENLLRTSLEEKEVLFQEVHHRVKNNLQIIASLLNISRTRLSDPDAIELVSQSCRRIELMASVYERVYQSQDIANIDFPTFLKQSAADLLEAYDSNSTQVTLTSTLTPLHLPVQATIYLGLVVHELISNALKHAFTGRKSGTIHLSLSLEPSGELIVQVSDNGVGMKSPANAGSSSSIGLRLISILVKQMSGNFTFHADHGTTCVIRFPSIPG